MYLKDTTIDSKHVGRLDSVQSIFKGRQQTDPEKYQLIRTPMKSFEFGKGFRKNIFEPVPSNFVTLPISIPRQFEKPLRETLQSRLSSFWKLSTSNDLCRFSENSVFSQSFTSHLIGRTYFNKKNL
uniref:Uncharacterized protein n=1 Tax=Rhipilia penicilloides TaxID=1979422 RepID=A0A2P0QHP8_9CHLO|nr:hypothetical protein [Rhipilia penicilloides]ARO74294.1 hypothetical protein [Rhipilia penicilloides]